MSDAYTYVRERVAGGIARFKTGTVTLTRTTRAAPADATPWIPGAATLDVYDLDVVVKTISTIRGAGAKYADGTVVLASDLWVITSPKARHTMHAGSPVDGSPVVDLEPEMTDTITIDGSVKTIKEITPMRAAGAAVRFNVFVAS